jgi:hypothetical protein
LLTNLLSNEVLDGGSQLVLSNRLEENHLLEAVQFLFPLTWHLFGVGIGRIKDLLEFLMVLDKVAINTPECWQLGHGVQLFVDLSPLDFIQPVSWVWFLLNLSTWTGQEELPLIQVNGVATE